LCRFRPTRPAHRCGLSIRTFPNDLVSGPLPGTAIVFATLPALVSNPHWPFPIRLFAQRPELASRCALRSEVFDLGASHSAGQPTNSSLESQERSEKAPWGTRLRIGRILHHLLFCSCVPAGLHQIGAEHAYPSGS